MPNFINNLIPAGVNDWTPGRVSFDYIILHTTDCSARQADLGFHTGARGSSAHRIAAEDGSIFVEVDDGNTAWGAANWYVNQRGLNLENEDNGNYNDPVRTPALYASSAWQVADWCRRYNIPCEKVGVDGNHTPTGRGIVLHREVSTQGTACPDGLDWQRIINEAQAILGGAAPATVAPESIPGVTPWGPGKVRCAVQALRVHSEPNTSSPGNVANTADGVLHQDMLFDVNGYLDGEDVTQDGQTSSRWLHTTNGHYVWAADTDFPIQNVVVATPVSPPPAPAPAPEYISSYAPEVATLATVTATVAIDAEGKSPDKPIPAGTIINQAGTFTSAGHKYVRTQYGEQHGTWYGIPTEAFQAQQPAPIPPQAISPASGKPVDSITLHPQSPADPAVPPATEPITAKLSPGQFVASVIAEIYGLFETYIRVVFGGKK